MSKKKKGDGNNFPLVPNELRKAVEAVHSSSHLSLLGHKLADVFIKNALPTIATQETFRISLADAKRGTKFDSNNTVKIKSAARELRNTPIEWDILAPDGGTSWGVTSYLSEVKIEGGIIEYSIPPTIRKLFALEAGRSWALIDLDLGAEFDSIYAHRLYQNCGRYRKVGSTGFRPVETWRRLLQAHAPSYDEFKYFKRVIDEAVKEVTDKTGLVLTPTYKKLGRSVSEICFYVSETKDVTPKIDAPADSESDKALIKRMCALGLKEKDARKYIEQLEPDYLEGNLALVEQRQRDGTIKKNAAAYLVSAFEKDYREVKSEHDIEREKELEKQAEAAAAAAAAEKANQEKKQHRSAEARARFDAASEDEQSQLLDEFSEHVRRTNSFAVKHLQKTGIAGPVVAPLFNEFLAGKYGI